MSDTDTLSTTAPEALALRMLADDLREHAVDDRLRGVVVDDLRYAAERLTELAGTL